MGDSKGKREAKAKVRPIVKVTVVKISGENLDNYVKNDKKYFRQIKKYTRFN